MKKYLEQLPQEIKDLISLCSSIARRHNYKAYLVGGFVRDLLLKVRNLDLDIVVEGDAIKLAEEFALCVKAKLVCHRRFGTATVILGHHLKVDFATAREECYPEPACLPSVKSGSVKDDLKRRDFSINAMSISINEHDYAELVDFFDGLKDLRDKKVRVLHDLSFIDDPTRILRAVRFEKRYDFRIEPKTLRLLKESVGLKMLNKVEPQRIRDELILILKENAPIKQLKRLQELAGLDFIHPGLSLGKQGFRLLKRSEEEIKWFKNACFARRHLDSWLVYFMCCLDGLSIGELKRVLKRFVFRRGEEKRLIGSKRISHGCVKRLQASSLRPSQVFKLLNPLAYETLIFMKAKYGNKVLNRHIEDFLLLHHSVRIHLSGDDLFELGHAPGPVFKKIFQKVFNAKLDGIVNTKEEELSFVKKMIGKKRS